MRIARVPFLVVVTMLLLSPFKWADTTLQECKKDCLIEIEGLQKEYPSGTPVKIHVRNRTDRELFVNVAAEGCDSGQWIEVVASVANPRDPFAKVVRLTQVGPRASVAFSYDPLAALEKRAKVVPRATKPTLFRLRVSVHSRKEMLQQVTSEPFRVVAAPSTPPVPN